MANEVLYKYEGTQTQWQLVKNALAWAYNWKAYLEDGSSNPETKSKHAQRKIREYLELQVEAYMADGVNAVRVAKILEAKATMAGTEVI